MNFPHFEISTNQRQQIWTNTKYVDFSSLKQQNFNFITNNNVCLIVYETIRPMMQFLLNSRPITKEILDGEIILGIE